MPDRYELLAHLITGYLRKDLTAAEQATLESWLAERSENQRFLDNLEDSQHLQQKLQTFHEVDRERLWALTQAKLNASSYRYPRRPVRRASRWLPYVAAALLAGVAVAGYFYREQTRGTGEIAERQVADIPAGGNRAMLTLADGRTITLDEARDGIVIGSGEITYNDGNPLTKVEGNQEVTWLKLSTPKGGTYQITLPDGTQAWLNAASTLMYPSCFSGTERLVKLTGEAYFSVAKDARKPFKVISAGQEVEVLGTEFNVSAYPDDFERRTTLVEGKVRLSLSGGKGGLTRGKGGFVELVPGEQGIVKGENLFKTDVDTALYTAWKSGYFYFKRTPLDDIMRQVARWYDVEVVYETGIPQETFSGDIKRDVSLNGLLEILQHSTIDVALKDRTLTVRK